MDLRPAALHLDPSLAGKLKCRGPAIADDFHVLPAQSLGTAQRLDQRFLGGESRRVGSGGITPPRPPLPLARAVDPPHRALTPPPPPPPPPPTHVATPHPPPHPPPSP